MKRSNLLHLSLFIGCAATLLTGCSSMKQIDSTTQRQFTFDFALPGHNKSDLWHTARDYFARAYGDSRAVFSVQDPEEGVFIGKGAAPWIAGVTDQCYSQYEIQFVAKDNKARLRFELLNGYADGTANCRLWANPSRKGYATIVASWQMTADSLRRALEANGHTEIKDF